MLLKIFFGPKLDIDKFPQKSTRLKNNMLCGSCKTKSNLSQIREISEILRPNFSNLRAKLLFVLLFIISLFANVVNVVYNEVVNLEILNCPLPFLTIFEISVGLEKEGIYPCF